MLMLLSKNEMSRLLAAVALVIFGVGMRLFLNGGSINGHNLEPITVVSLLAGSMLAGRYTFLVPLAVVGITDAIIGNSSILLFTWSGWVGVGLLGRLLRGRAQRPIRFTLAMTGMGLVGTIWFYLWTNFGVWAIGSMYPHTAAGLLQSYIMGIPFLKPQLFGNLLIVPVVTMVYLGVRQWVSVFLGRDAEGVARSGNQ